MKKISLALTVFTLILSSCNDENKEKKNDETVVSSTTEMKPSKPDTTVVVTIIEPPAKAKETFVAKHPKATNVEWKKYNSTEPVQIDWELTKWPKLDTSYYTVHYIDNGYDYWSFYTPEGEWVASTTTVKKADVPAPVNNVLASKEFKDYTVTSVDKENDKNMLAYEIKMEKGEDKVKMLIRDNGDVLKIKGKIDGDKFKDKMVK
jgi:hypothetical protein